MEGTSANIMTITAGTRNSRCTIIARRAGHIRCMICGALPSIFRRSITHSVFRRVQDLTVTDPEPNRQLAAWLFSFQSALNARDIPSVTALFAPDECYWRD